MFWSASIKVVIMIFMGCLAVTMMAKETCLQARYRTHQQEMPLCVSQHRNRSQDDRRESRLLEVGCACWISWSRATSPICCLSVACAPHRKKIRRIWLLSILRGISTHALKIADTAKRHRHRRRRHRHDSARENSCQLTSTY
jgi:hypothetical protein